MRVAKGFPRPTAVVLYRYYLQIVGSNMALLADLAPQGLELRDWHLRYSDISYAPTPSSLKQVRPVGPRNASQVSIGC